MPVDEAQTTSAPPPPRLERPDLAGGLRTFLGLEIGVRLLFWSAPFAVATWVISAAGGWPDTAPADGSFASAWNWGQRLTLWIVLYNLTYVLMLVVLRLIVPTPREGSYSTLDKVPDRQVIWSCFVALLTKARLDPVFPAFLVPHMASLPPMVWLMRPIFGPDSQSTWVTDPNILDPHLVTIGRNVVIGFNTTVAGHYQERDCIVMKRTIIEDDALIGGHVVIYGNVRIRRGAQVGSGAIVLPGTDIGENEFWGGVPARKIKDLPAVDAVEAS
jgi:carbonic anhydrase/acetyltransferase-like protein (isoleucine patch superfamily)